MDYPIENTGYTKFRAWMRENHIKSSDLADLLGVSEATISKKLNGFSDFTVVEVRVICTTYGISADEYFIAYKVS